MLFLRWSDRSLVGISGEGRSNCGMRATTQRLLSFTAAYRRVYLEKISYHTPCSFPNTNTRLASLTQWKARNSTSSALTVTSPASWNSAAVARTLTTAAESANWGRDLSTNISALRTPLRKLSCALAGCLRSYFLHHARELAANGSVAGIGMKTTPA
jgi:hypothetical protein